MSRFQRYALIAFITVEVLIFVGAIVRTTGSGLGCPDWPFCYGCLVPPSSADEIDFTKIDLEKFLKKAERLGRDPATITPERLKAEFDSTATWIEYINRLTSIPVGLSVMLMWGFSFGEARRGRKRVFITSTLSVLLVGINAWLGARVVLSGLKPGIITLHMALAIMLQCMLVYTAWRGTSQPWRLAWKTKADQTLRWLAWGLFVLVVVEGIMGSQVRELTDELARTHAGHSRAEWVHELEASWVYLIHRSFSWLILAVGFLFFFRSRHVLQHRGWLEISITAIIVSQMLLGVVLANVGIVAVAQVLHIGLSSLLVSGLFLWLLGSGKVYKQGSVS
ncbi:COX15/CtaA family protein [Brevifollis gellanilyticus]|uniref:Cytochrome c oxidase subunit I n=1 Tax=Brevifollis gellanilyticus TaxID=748831 RepID=A0A512MBU6_9BACT|nr:COX15/CtaA family protein [Brevifollis gellanilyticus]GEP44208.1 cytochrome c oxidase subunit I [Brevifollis gellanilyticus]